MALMAVGDQVQVLSNPDAPAAMHQWRQATLESFAADPELGEQILMVRYPGELDATPVPAGLARRAPGLDDA